MEGDELHSFDSRRTTKFWYNYVSPYLGRCFFYNTPRLWRWFSNKLATCYKLHETIGQRVGYLSIEDEVFPKRQTDVYFGRIKTIIFFLKSWSNIQMFKSCISLGFRQAIVCLAYVTLRKLRIDQTLLALPVTLKMGISMERPFLLWKYIGNEEKLWYFNRKSKGHFALKRTSICMRDTWTSS